MPNLVGELIVDRVDLVEEGANSAAFIELYKRKETVTMTVEEILSQMEPEHAEVLKAKLAEGAKAEQDLLEASTNLEKATNRAADAEAKLPCECDGEAGDDGICKACGKKKVTVKAKTFDEVETLKALPKEAREYLETLKTQKEVAEKELKKSQDAIIDAEAIAKAAELKAIPVEQSVLVSVLKNASPSLVEVLTAASKAIDEGVLGEVGKSGSGTGSTGNSTDANPQWARIENEADKLVKSAEGKITQAKAIAEVIKSNPQLYTDYLNGGAE